MKKLVAYLIIFIVALILFIYGINWFSGVAETEEAYIQERAIRRACITCYAVEGIYPPNINYIEDNYGIIINHKKYIVHFEIFASNIMPDIALIERNGDNR